MTYVTKIMEEQRKILKINPNMPTHDKNCPYTGNLRVRKKTFTGIVVSKDTHGTAKVEWTTKSFLKKYERFFVKKTKVAAHNPAIINAQVGDEVIIAECRPISKTKKFVIIKNLGHSKSYALKKLLIEEDKKAIEEAKKNKTKRTESEKEDSNEKNNEEE